MSDEQEVTTTGPSYSQVLRVALDVLSVRVARWATLVMAGGFFGATIWKPSWIRLATAATFTILVNLPLWWRKEK